MTTYTPDNLIAGSVMPLVSEGVTLLTGTNYVLGTVLGKEKFAVGSIAAGSNTGDATIASAVLAANVQLGTYTVKCITAPSSASANDAVFAVYAPDGSRLLDAVQGVAYAGGHLVFTVGDATSTDSIVGDSYTIAVIAGSGKLKTVNSNAVDGSQSPIAVLAENADATLSDKVAGAYLTGIFNESKLVFGGSDTVATHKEAMRKIGLFTKKTIGA